MIEKRIIPKQNVHDDFKLAPQPAPVPASTDLLLTYEEMVNAYKKGEALPVPNKLKSLSLEIIDKRNNGLIEVCKAQLSKLQQAPFPDEQGIRENENNKVKREVLSILDNNYREPCQTLGRNLKHFVKFSPARH